MDKLNSYERKSYVPVANAGCDYVMRSHWRNGRPVDVVMMKFPKLGQAFFVGALPEPLLPKDAEEGAEQPLEERVDILDLPTQKSQHLLMAVQLVEAQKETSLVVSPHYLFSWHLNGTQIKSAAQEAAQPVPA